MKLASTERFWSKVDKSGDCWEWTATKNRKGYGQIYWGGSMRYVHRISWEITNGEIPSGLQIDHVCHNRACVNPEHLRLATHKQNQENTDAQVNSKSGIRGVTWIESRRKWRATVRHNGHDFFIGYFPTPDSAKNAAIAKRNELFTHNDMDRIERDNAV